MMQLIVPLIILLNVIFVKGSKCNPTNCKNYAFEEHYRDLNCRPIYYKKDSCPTYYECPVLSLMAETSDKCYYHAQVFNIGDTLDNIEGDRCYASCGCAKAEDNQPPTFLCAIYDCAAPIPDCRPIFSLDSCCASYSCDEPDATVRKCTKEGETYLAGQKFTLKSDPCTKCVCGEDGRTKCKKFSCDLQIHYSNFLKQYCAPVYYGKTSCCPNDFLCPGDGITIHNQTTNEHTGRQCKFGNNLLQIGTKITVKDRPCLSCNCKTPPLVSCYEDPNCQP